MELNKMPSNLNRPGLLFLSRLNISIKACKLKSSKNIRNNILPKYNGINNADTVNTSYRKSFHKFEYALLFVFILDKYAIENAPIIKNSIIINSAFIESFNTEIHCH